MSKSKKENIIVQEAIKRKDMPGPNSYKLDYDWTKNAKGIFMKGKRITEAEVMLKYKGKTPGPGSYKVKDGYRIQNVPKQDLGKSAFIDNAVAISMQTPGAKYKIKDDITRPRSAAPRYYKLTDSEKKPTSIKPKKTSDPAPGSYKMEESYKSTQMNNRNYSFVKGRIKNYID